MRCVADGGDEHLIYNTISSAMLSLLNIDIDALMTKFQREQSIT